MTPLPQDTHITYTQEYRKCGKPLCTTCKTGKGHGPYWYFYYRDGSRLRNGYIGKELPQSVLEQLAQEKQQEQSQESEEHTI